MAMSLTRGASRTILAIMLLLAIAVPAMAESPTSNTPAVPATSTCPIFIVSTHTDIPDQGAPTLDIVDLQNYFVKVLTERGLADVVSRATTQVSAATGTNVYVLRLSVDALDRAVRTKVDEYNHEVPDPVFHVALSLTVQGPQGEIGRTGAWRDHHLQDVDALQNNVLAKRTGIYLTADDLADRFVAELQAGRYGAVLVRPTPPTFWETYWQRLMAGDKTATGLTVTVAFVFFFVFLIIVSASTNSTGCTANKRAQSRKVWGEIADDRQVEKAIELWLETDGFCDEAIRAAAEKDLQKTLATAPTVFAAEAERQRTAQDREKEYARIAACAALHADVSEQDLINILWWADAWPYQVLLEAKRIVEEAGQ